MSKTDSQASKIKEISQIGENKKCFDCGQRGPTYANITVGTFVCTTCSGILRGLNNPHRIKSISMATFTEQEVDFLRKTGNNNNRFWMAKWMPSEPLPTHNPKDESKMKDYLKRKYDQKLWYSTEPVTSAKPKQNEPILIKQSSINREPISQDSRVKKSSSSEPFGFNQRVSVTSVSQNTKNLLDFDVMSSNQPNTTSSFNDNLFGNDNFDSFNHTKSQSQIPVAASQTFFSQPNNNINPFFQSNPQVGAQLVQVTPIPLANNNGPVQSNIPVNSFQSNIPVNSFQSNIPVNTFQTNSLFQSNIPVQSNVSIQNNLPVQSNIPVQSNVQSNAPAPSSSSDKYAALSVLDDIFRSPAQPSVFSAPNKPAQSTMGFQDSSFGGVQNTQSFFNQPSGAQQTNMFSSQALPTNNQNTFGMNQGQNFQNPNFKPSNPPQDLFKSNMTQTLPNAGLSSQVMPQYSQFGQMDANILQFSTNMQQPQFQVQQQQQQSNPFGGFQAAPIQTSTNLNSFGSAGQLPGNTNLSGSNNNPFNSLNNNNIFASNPQISGSNATQFDSLYGNTSTAPMNQSSSSGFFPSNSTINSNQNSMSFF